MDSERRRDFRVRRGKIEAALCWLSANNKWYRDVTISQDRLSQLPLDGNLEDEFVRPMDDFNVPRDPAAVDEPAPEGVGDGSTGDNGGRRIIRC